MEVGKEGTQKQMIEPFTHVVPGTLKIEYSNFNITSYELCYIILLITITNDNDNI